MPKKHSPTPTSLTALQTNTTPSAPDLSAETLSEQTLTIPHYGLTHPKAYIGYTLALSAADTPEHAQTLTTDYIINTPVKARTGAINLGLVTPNSDQLTETGHKITNHAINTYGTLTTALETFDTLRGTQKRLTEIDTWHTLTPELIKNDPAATKLITLLNTIHTERNDPPDTGIPLPELVHELYYENPPFTVQLLLRDTDHIRNQLDDAGTFNHSLLQKPSTYRGAGVYQFKNILYHLGALTTRGADTTTLTPATDYWALEPTWRTDI